LYYESLLKSTNKPREIERTNKNLKRKNK